MQVGLVGCGNISATYLNNAPMFADDFQIVAVSDIDLAAAAAIGNRHGIPRAVSTI